MDPMTAMMLGSSALSGLGSILGGIFGNKAQDDAAKRQAQTNQQVQSYFSPYQQAGTNALGQLETAYGGGDPATLAARRSQLMDQFHSSPLYQATYQPAIDEATREIQRQGAANGSLNSGATLQALYDRAGRLGGQLFGNYIGGISDMAGNGFNAASNAANALTGGTQAYNQYKTGGTDALVAGGLGFGNALNQGVGQLGFMNALSKYGPSVGSSSYSQPAMTYTPVANPMAGMY